MREAMGERAMPAHDPPDRCVRIADTARRQRNRLVRIRNRLLLIDRPIDFRVFHERPIVAVYPQLGLIYNRVMKSGNSTLTAFLNDLSSGRSYQAIADMKESILRPGDMSAAQVLRMRGYYAFTFVRNPYSRMLSSFLHKVAAGENPEYRRVPGFGERSPQAFERFLDWLAEGHLGEDTHWRPQRDLLYQAPERFDRVGRIECMAADMGRVLEETGRDPKLAEVLASPHEIEARAGNKLTSASSQMDAFYTPSSRAAVRRLHAADFEAFGYPE